MADFNLGAYDFTGMGVPSMPVLPEQNWLGKMKNISPESWGILLGQMGAGIGGPGSVGEAIGGPTAAFGQSSLANRAMQEQRQDRLNWQKMLAGAFGLGTSDSGLDVPKTPSLKSDLGSMSMSDTTKALTPVDQTGPSKTTTKLDASGNTVRTTEEIIAKPKKQQSIDLGDIMSSPF